MPASPGHDEAGGHMKVSLINPNVPRSTTPRSPAMTTRDVYDRHLRNELTGDLDTILSDYDPGGDCRYL